MTQKQVTMINCINKAVRQHFLFKSEPGMDPVKIRLRSDVHRVEQVDQDNIDAKILQRLHDNQIGHLNPQNKPFEPVAGWPVLNLDELVLNAMDYQLDPKAWLAVRSQFDKHEIKKAYDRLGGEEILKDMTAVHQYPTAGFQAIKAHLAESEARLQNVKAGFSFHQHFNRSREERLRRREVKPEGFVKYFSDADMVKAMERVRRDTLKFLASLIEYLDMLIQIKVRHLRYPMPINLSLLGTDKDKEIFRPPPKVQAFPGGPLLPYNFKDQIVSEAPPNWPIATALGNKSHKVRLASSPRVDIVSFSSDKGRAPPSRKSLVSQGTAAPSSGHSSVAAPQASAFLPNLGPRRGTLRSPSSKAAGNRGSNVDSDTGSEKGYVVRMFHDPEMTERFRKRWPPPWITLAALEQGLYVVDPACPTKEYNQCLTAPAPRRRKSLTNILETRREWAEVRKAISKSVDECLEREDTEKKSGVNDTGMLDALLGVQLDFWRVQFDTLSRLPLCKPYPTHQHNIEDQMATSRRKRQKDVILDCELSGWYKFLLAKVEEEVGSKDEEINAWLKKVKHYFKMSKTSPRFGKAKLALITMSLPAYTVLQLHVQRALDFILVHVMEAPGQLLTGWLSARGLPNVLVKKLPPGPVADEGSGAKVHFVPSEAALSAQDQRGNEAHDTLQEEA